ncbi:zinc finger, CCHC-type containing protein [Tanacetum coccineum]
MGDDHFTPVHGKGSVVLEFSSGKSITLFNVLAIVRLPDPKRKTLGENGIDCIFVGYVEHSKAYKFYVIEPNDSVSINTIIESKDAIFDENLEGSRDQTGFQYSYYYNIEEYPRTYNEVVQSRDVALWKEAIDDEIGSIMKNNTWVLSDLPPGVRQKEGIDYFDTYAPVARITTIRLLLALAAIHNLQQEGFVMPGNEHKVCKLVKSLYGLKQAPKQWHQKFDKVVLSSGFLLNQSDKYVYSKFDGSEKGVIICLYVDDMLIFGIDQNQVDNTKKVLSLKFSMKDMGEADVILGIKIKRKNKGIVITQSHYIEKILKKFNREDCSPVSTLMDPVEKLMTNTGKPVDQLEYSRAIGCLMYAMTSTRPGIACAVEGYSDASWINHVEDSSSTTRWVFLLEGGTISWAFKKQTCITSSTMESEFVVLVVAGKEAEWLRT